MAEYKKLEHSELEILRPYLSELEGFRDLMTWYRCAMMEVETKLRVLNEDFNRRHDTNPFESIRTRIKTPESIVEKLIRKGLPVTLDNIENAIDDVAGIRVICSYPEDIYGVAGLLARQDDILVLKVEDYIRHPKLKGYRSLHQTVQVPIFLSTAKKYMKVEIQYRTMAMDFWASLDHKMTYKHTEERAESVMEELRQCADTIWQMDMKMQSIHHQLEYGQDETKNPWFTEPDYASHTALQFNGNTEPEHQEGEPMKKTLGIIGAEQQEIDLLLDLLKVTRSVKKAASTFYVGTIHDYPVVIVRCGIGKVNAAACAQMLIDLFNVEMIINTGAAGSLNAQIDIGDVVLSTDVIQHDLDVKDLGYELGMIPDTGKYFTSDATLRRLAKECCEESIPDIHTFEGRILTGDQFVSGPTMKDHLIKEFDGMCAEMEGGAIAQVATLNNVPFLIVRAISDKADGSATMSYQTFSQMASIHSARLVEGLIKKL